VAQHLLSGNHKVHQAKPKSRQGSELDIHAGVMWSKVTGSLASGYLNFQIIGPTVGLGFQF
jgi:hypothetical protein